MIGDDLSKTSFEGVMIVRWLGTLRNTAAFSIVEAWACCRAVGAHSGPLMVHLEVMRLIFKVESLSSRYYKSPQRFKDLTKYNNKVYKYSNTATIFITVSDS